MVKPDHENGIYAPNEKVTWNVDFTGDRAGLPALAYVVKEDGQIEVGKGTVDVSAGPTTITASRSTPGVLVAQIYPAAKTSGYAVAVGGAVISPDKINLNTPVAADFDAFWQGKLKELAAVPVNPVVTPEDISTIKFTGSINFYKVMLDNINGTHVYGQMARPKDGKKFPAMLIVQSAGVYPLDKTPVIANAKAGWLVLNIIAHDLPIDEPPDFYTKLKATTLKDYQFIGCDDRDKSYFLRMFLGCARAVDYLTSRPDWNGKVLLVTGGSQGGFQSFATAALCPQITDVAAFVPAGCDLLAPLATPPRAFGWPYWTSYWVPKELDKKKIQETAGYYDGINFAARIHCPTLMCVGLIDDTARPTGVIAAYNAIKAPKELLILPLSDHHGTGNAQAAYYQEFNVWRGDLHDGKPLPATKRELKKCRKITSHESHFNLLFPFASDHPLLSSLSLLLGAAFLIDCRADTAQPPTPDPWNATLLTVTPDHTNGIYALSEPAVWTVNVTTGDRSALAAVPYVVKRDGGDAIANGTIDLSVGPATITATRAEPGALLAVISVPTETVKKRPRPFTGGAIFAPEKIGPGAPAPADFDDFWKAQLQYLDAIPPNPVVEKGSLDDVKYNDGIPYYKVNLDNIWHTQVHGQLSRPVKGDKFPAIIVFQAAGVGPLQKGMVVKFAKQGFLVLNIEAHDMPIDESPAFYNNLKATTLKDYVAIGVGSRDTYYFLRMVLGCIRAAEYLTSRPDWDGKTLIVCGVSQGGFQSFATAALFPQVTAVVTSAPAGDDSAAPLANPPRPPSWPASYLPPRPDDPDGSKARATLGYFDTTYFAARVHCPVLACVGLIDETVRPASVLATYNAIPGTNKELIVLPFYEHSLACSQPPFWHRQDEWTAAAKAGQPLPPALTPAQTPNATLISGPIPTAATSVAAPAPH